MKHGFLHGKPGETWRLEAFEAGKDIYCESASQMFHVPVVKHGINGELRQKGKVAELACGYGGSTGCIDQHGRTGYGLKETELPDLIDDWRGANPKIVQYWWEVEKAAIQTLKTREEHKIGNWHSSIIPVRYGMVLPSGRKLAYLKAQDAAEPLWSDVIDL